MRIAIVAVGRLKAGPERELVDRYKQRIGGAGRAVGLTGLDVIEIDESRARRGDDRRADEAKTILSRVPSSAALVALDERGRDVASDDFARLVARHSEEGRDLAFVIGGSDGIDPPLLLRTERQLRFGAMTLPHQIVRVLLVEQIYRAMTILSGHPYHRGADHRDV